MKRRSRRRAAFAEAQQAAEQALRRAEQAERELRTAYDAALGDSGVVLFQQVAPEVDAYHVSTSASQLLGWDPAIFLGAGVLRGMVHPEDLARLDAAMHSSRGRGTRSSHTSSSDTSSHGTSSHDVGETDALEVIDLTAGSATAVTSSGTDQPLIRVRSSAGHWQWFRVRPHREPHPGVARGSMTLASIERSDLVRQRRFAEMVESDPGAHLVLEFTDPLTPESLVIRAANAAALAMLHLDPDLGDGTPVDAVLGPASAQLLRAALFDVSHTGQPMTAERLSLAEVPGTYLDLRVARLRDGTVSVVIDDVTATAALEERLRHQASHDALTGLPNRELFEERLAAALAAVDESAPIAIVLVDVVGFADLNDRLGVHLADRLLVDLGRRLVREVRGMALVSRLGGDRFALLTLPVASSTEAVERGRAVRAVLDRPFELEGHLTPVDTTVVVAPSGDTPGDPALLIRSALDALRTARDEREPFRVVSDEPAVGSIHRLGLLSELRQGLANRDLELRFQPVVELRTGGVTKVEAVLRWRDDTERADLPVEFLELAEHSGLIQPLTRWILGEAAGAASDLARAGLSVVVSADLSLRNMFDPDLLTFIQLLVSSGELDPTRVELEVSETELMDDPVRAQEVLRKLADLGLGVVIDDFGTGYTSLSTVQHLPIRGLKIDRSFVSTVGSDGADAAIVRSTIDLCHELGLEVGADGVPDDRTLGLLAGFGCDLAQGTHLCEPVTLDELPTRMRSLEDAARAWTGTGLTA